MTSQTAAPMRKASLPSSVAEIWHTEILRAARVLNTHNIVCPCACAWNCLGRWIQQDAFVDPDTVAVTRFRTKSVLFNTDYTDDTPIETVYTARHEIAHIVVHTLHPASIDHHGPRWHAVCVLLGGVPETSRAPAVVFTPAGRRRTVDP